MNRETLKICIERECRWYFLFILFSKQHPFAGIGEIVDLVNEQREWIENG